MRLIAMVSVSMFLACSIAFADLSDLMELARNQADIQKDNQKETASYNTIRSAFDRGALEPGRSKSDIIRQYGEPVVTLQDKKKNMKKWIYKKASESFFGGEQLYLFFDDKGLLVQVEFRTGDKPKEAGR